MHLNMFPLSSFVCPSLPLSFPFPSLYQFTFLTTKNVWLSIHMSANLWLYSVVYYVLATSHIEVKGILGTWSFNANSKGRLSVLDIKESMNIYNNAESKRTHCLVVRVTLFGLGPLFYALLVIYYFNIVSVLLTWRVDNILVPTL